MNRKVSKPTYPHAHPLLDNDTHIYKNAKVLLNTICMRRFKQSCAYKEKPKIKTGLTYGQTDERTIGLTDQSKTLNPRNLVALGIIISNLHPYTQLNTKPNCNIFILTFTLVLRFIVQQY